MLGCPLLPSPFYPLRYWEVQSSGHRTKFSLFSPDLESASNGPLTATPALLPFPCALSLPSHPWSLEQLQIHTASSCSSVGLAGHLSALGTSYAGGIPRILSDRSAIEGEEGEWKGGGEAITMPSPLH